ncbi:hypothetical protein NESM_000770900 [Novymonas esmeraldas]|uniref:Nuclear pore complex protein n=1 Tax=Novymonas esmeraldas TaxID=1808958 RepID=A0AAW0EWL7_9TRYP
MPCVQGQRRGVGASAGSTSQPSATHEGVLSAVHAAGMPRDAPGPSPPSLTPVLVPASRGLAAYFDGIASGAEMSELVRHLRFSMWRCYQDCHHQPAPVDVPLVPAPVPSHSLRPAERRRYWAATKAAMLFAAESPAAAEEATTLHCSAVTRSLLHHYYCPSEGGGPAGGASRTNAALCMAPAMSTLHRGEVRWLLSDVRVVELAKAALRDDHVDTGAGDGWQRALALLQQVDPTPLTSAVELDLYRRTDGHHWAEALRCLWRIPPAHWTEMDVAAAVRCLYAAGRRTHRHRRGDGAKADAAVSGGVEDTHTSSSLAHTRLMAQALRIHHAVEEAGVLRWSTPSVLNDTLGLVALDAAGWQDACALLEKLLAGARSRALAAGDGFSSGAAAAAADTSAGETESPPATAFACTVAALEEATEEPVTCTFYQPESAYGVAEDSVLQRTTPLQSPYLHVSANAVTVHHTCRALQSHWAVGLHYVQLLQDAFQDTLHLEQDVVATEDVLRLCIAGQRWEAALQLVRAHQAAAAERMGTGVTTGAARATLPQHRQHYRADVFLQLVRLLGSTPASRGAACELLHRYAVPPSAASAAVTTDGVLPRTPQDSHRTVTAASNMSLSKHYNTDTISRAFNCLIQNAATLDAAEDVLRQLHHAERAQPNARVAGVVDGGSGSLDHSDAALAGLETESVAHIAYLSAVAGDWRRALHHTDALLCQQRYRTTFLPTARLHDAVQYALEQAPPPGPPWQVSLRLFTQMMERHVPSSEVAFQSAVKRCFAGGVPDQAQRLFYDALRRGVRQ